MATESNLVAVNFTVPDSKSMSTGDWRDFGKNIAELPGLNNFDIEPVFTGGCGKVIVDIEKVAEVRARIEALGLRISE